MGPGETAGAAVGGLIGLAALALLALVAARGSLSKKKPVMQRGAAAAGASVLVVNPIASGGGATFHQNVYAQNVVFHQHPPLAEQPTEALLPEGWQKFGPDEDGDEWYVDAQGNSHWELPAPGTRV